MALEKGANANGVGVEMSTPLAAAAMVDAVDVVELLIEREADPDARLETQDGWALSKAKSVPVVEALVAAGADPLYLSSKNNAQTVAHEIARFVTREEHDPVGVLKYYKSVGVDFDHNDARGTSVRSILEREIETGRARGGAEALLG